MKAMGRHGMVASPHYLATGAGVNVLRQGGSAVDAAIATNAVLAVVTPYMCGIGGDLFAQVYSASDRSLIGINASGRAPAEASLSRMRELAGDNIPARGPLSITVPGCVDGWGRLHDRFGRIPLSRVLADAVTYAEDGFPVTANFSRSIAAIAPILHPDTPARETFLPNGSPPREGTMFRQPRIAQTLQTIGREGADAYYRGGIGVEIVRAVRDVGGLLSEEDLAGHHAEWVEPLSVRYRDVEVFELPPNTQGVIALLALNVLNSLPADDLRVGDASWVHFLAEVSRLAYAERAAHLTDPEHMRIDPQQLLSTEYAFAGAARLGDAASIPSGEGAPGGTIYLCAADGEGNLVSLIESNWMGIGSGIMGGDTGVMLQNRGHWFSLDPTAANVIAPRKRTMHTLIPGMAFRDGRPWLVFGTMGGSGQAQIHVELLTRLIDGGMTLDGAIDAPRFDAVNGWDAEGLPVLAMEGRFAPEVIEELRRRGHGVQVAEAYSSAFGHAHAIQILDDGVYVGAADPRHDSLAMGY